MMKGFGTMMITMLAKVKSDKDIEQDLYEATDKYKIDPTEDNKHKLTFACVLFVHKQEVDKVGLDAMMKKIERLGQAEQLLDTEKETSSN